MNKRSRLRLTRIDRRITRQLPKGQSYYPEFYWPATDPTVAMCPLAVGATAVVDEIEVRRNPSQAALLHLVKVKHIAALHAIQGYAEQQIRDLEKVT